MTPRSPTEARALLLAWWLDVAERPCGHDPLDVREEREGIVCSDCELDGVAWYVAPVYLGPVSRTQALAHAEAYACDLPSRALVDAIWKAADLRLDPTRLARDPAKPGAAERHARHVVALVEDAAEQCGGPFALLAGSHKDFAREGERVDLYGWHDLTGRPVQPWGSSHSAEYVDYSQGLRLVRRVA